MLAVRLMERCVSVVLRRQCSVTLLRLRLAAHLLLLPRHRQVALLVGRERRCLKPPGPRTPLHSKRLAGIRVDRACLPASVRFGWSMPMLKLERLLRSSTSPLLWLPRRGHGDCRDVMMQRSSRFTR